MKKVSGLLAGLALVSVAHAADTTEFKWNAELRTRYMSNENTKNGAVGTPGPGGGNSGNKAVDDFKDIDNNIKQRNKLGVSMMRGEDLSAHVTLLNTMKWGGSATAATATTADSVGQPTQGAANDTAMIHEAWAAWKFNDNITGKFGRMGMTIADGTVVSQNDWLDTPFVFEGAGVLFDYDFGRISLLGVKAGDNVTDTQIKQPGATDPELVYYGVSFDVKNLPDFLKMANVHVLQENRDEYQTTSTTDVRGLNLMRYGITLGGDTHNFDYRATYAGLSGKLKNTYSGVNPEEINWTGSMIDATVGYTFGEFMNARIGATYHQDSGDDDTNTTAGSDGAKDLKTYQPFFYERHKNAGQMDIIGWGNLTYWDFQFTIEPMEKLTAGLNYLIFSRTQASRASDGVFAESMSSTAHASFTTTSPMLGGTTAATNTTGTFSNNEKDIGTELDIYATQKYDNGASITARYGLFTVGEHLKKTAAASPADSKAQNATQFMLEGTLTF